MNQSIPVMANFDSYALDGIIGKIEFADTPKAILFYEMLKARPDQNRLEICYSKSSNGGYILTEVSLVPKYSKRHPIQLLRRVKYQIRMFTRSHRSHK